MVHSGVYGRYPASRRDPPPVCGQTMDSGSFSFHMNVEGWVDDHGVKAVKIPVNIVIKPFGTGAFYSALLRVFPGESIGTSHGFEVDPHYGLPAKQLWEPTGLRLALSDFTAASPDGNDAECADLLVCNSS